jgi:hypothetical protein
MKRILFVVVTVALLGTALTGCRVEGEVGDTASQVAPAR